MLILDLFFLKWEWGSNPATRLSLTEILHTFRTTIYLHMYLYVSGWFFFFYLAFKSLPFHWYLYRLFWPIRFQIQSILNPPCFHLRLRLKKRYIKLYFVATLNYSTGFFRLVYFDFTLNSWSFSEKYFFCVKLALFLCLFVSVVILV